MSKTLVIILSETRAHELTFNNFKKNVIDELNADLYFYGYSNNCTNQEIDDFLNTFKFKKYFITEYTENYKKNLFQETFDKHICLYILLNIFNINIISFFIIRYWLFMRRLRWCYVGHINTK